MVTASSFFAGEQPFNAQVLIILGIIFSVLLLLAGKILLQKLFSSKSCMNIKLRKIRKRRSTSVFPENTIPPIVIANVRAQSAPTLHDTASPYYCEQCIAEASLNATRPDLLEGRSQAGTSRSSSKSVHFLPKALTMKRAALKSLKKEKAER